MATDPGTRAMQAKRRKQWMLLAVLAVVAVAIGAVRFAQSVPSPATASPNTASTPTATSDRDPADASLAFEVTWPVELERDLFAWERVFPAVEPPETEPIEAEAVEQTPDAAAVRAEAERTVKLQAIIFGEEPIAMINGQVWRQGQTIEGFHITRIESRRLVLRKHGVEVVLELSPPRE